jgi:ABC-2 type transport system ATP-binding protein
MGQAIVSVQHLSHKYSTSWAIRDINIEIHKNGIVGLLGSNGAGKSTTMNIMCGVLNQTEGRVLINGTDIREQPELAKKQIGFLPQNPPLYMDLTVNEYLRYTADLRKIDPKRIKASMDEVKDRCGIAHFGGRLIKNLSGGYRQRVGIAQSIIHKPILVVMDEPTNGLDPNQITEVRALIKEIAQEHAVIFSSHVLSEVQLLCKEIKMIEKGQIIFSDTMDAFNNYIQPHTLVMHMKSPPKPDELTKISGVEKVEFLTEKQARIFFEGDAEITERLIKASINGNWRLCEITLEKAALDEIFKQLSSKPININ